MNQFDSIKVAAAWIETTNRERLAAAESLEDKCRVAFKEAAHLWMSTDEDVRFKGAIGAVLIHVGEGTPEWKRLEAELKQIATLGAAVSGVPVDWERANFLPDGFEPIGLFPLWKEISA